MLVVRNDFDIEGLKMNRVSTITHPSGRSLHYCEELTNFVINRHTHDPFIIGHWFQSLDVTDLACIQKLAHAVLEERQDEFEDFEVDDVVGLVTIAASVETEDRMSFGPDDLFNLIGALVMVSGVSYMCRLGWLKAYTPLSILPSASVEMEITDSGMAAVQRTHDPLLTAIFAMASTRQ